jgi:hypothetical protein
VNIITMLRAGRKVFRFPTWSRASSLLQGPDRIEAQSASYPDVNGGSFSGIKAVGA